MGMMLATAWTSEQWALLLLTVIGAVTSAVVTVISALRRNTQHAETTAELTNIHGIVNDRLDSALGKIADLEGQVRNLTPPAG